MNLLFDTSLCKNYSSHSQIARVLTESWVENNMYCPHCGNNHVVHFNNNRPVADFYCDNCKNEYELKSKNGNFGTKINDGSYDTMIARISSNNNPDFFLMSYSENSVKDFIFIPKHFFVPDIIEKRKPLSETARRAGWTGCNILLEKIPVQGRISIISNETINNIHTVLDKVKMAEKLQVNNISARGWLFDILNCVNSISSETFSLSDMYCFSEELKQKHPNNNNIQPKIRQQLQLLRDRGTIEFLGNGLYRKV